MNLTLLCIFIGSFMIGTINAASPSYRYGGAANDPYQSPGFGRGLYDFLFGPWPRRPNYETQRPTYNRPKPDFANDKVPDYDLYLLGWFLLENLKCNCFFSFFNLRTHLWVFFRVSDVSQKVSLWRSKKMYWNWIRGL